MCASLTEGLNDRPRGHFHLLPRMCIGGAILPVPTRLHAVVHDEAVHYTVTCSTVHGASPAQHRTQRRYASGNFSNSRVMRVSIHQALSSASCTFSANPFQVKLWKVVSYFASKHKSNCLQTKCYELCNWQAIQETTLPETVWFIQTTWQCWDRSRWGDHKDRIRQTNTIKNVGTKHFRK
jgi:hypothetical protein